MKHLLTLEQLSKEELLDILNLADQLKFQKKNGIPHELLKGKTLGMIWRTADISFFKRYADRQRRACTGYRKGIVKIFGLYNDSYL